MDKATLDRIRKNLLETKGKIDEMKTDLINARRAGMDVTAIETTITDLENRYRKMVAVYGLPA